jgi:hypothetical protein
VGAHKKMFGGGEVVGETGKRHLEILGRTERESMSRLGLSSALRRSCALRRSLGLYKSG